MNKPKFGPAGADDRFYELGYKRSAQVPEYIAAMGLAAFEYQCGRGVKITEKSAYEIRDEAAKYGITMSLHAPYFISLASDDEAKRENSINYIRQSMQAVRWLGGDRIVIHPGGAGKDRAAALELAKQTLVRARAIMDDEGYGDIFMCPEVMGVTNQLGTFDEIMDFCSLDERFIPTIDFGHHNARTAGGLKTEADYLELITKMENKLGADRTKIFHSHFSKIEYTEKSGERKHLTFEDEIYGPFFEPLAEILYKKSLTPTIICESRGTQSQDSVAMMNIYDNISKGIK